MLLKILGNDQEDSEECKFYFFQEILLVFVKFCCKLLRQWGKITEEIF